MEEALARVQELAAQDEDSRRKAVAALPKLASSLENVQETINRYGHLHLQSAMVQTGVELGLFKHLSDSPEGLTVEQISDKTGAERQLIVRSLRYLAAIGSVEEVGKGRYAANHVTRNLSESFYLSAPPFQAIPKFLKETNYRLPDDASHTPFQLALGTDKSIFEWFVGQPELLGHFNNYMALHRKQTEGLSWLSVYPVETEAAGKPAEQPLYVDIGGGIGHQCKQFKEKFPDLPGRVVLQDLPHSIARAFPTPGVENMAHDFFTPQPVLGAKFYYLHAVLHNQSPSNLRKLLENTKAAMAADSVLLIDEMVLPETGVSAIAASIDLTMLSSLASAERTKEEWGELLDDIGLEIVKTYTYNERTYETVMDIRLPKAA
ncbi:hypothetical protein INS49_004117 [Diaporthe citri]|uniref:uncharacterized protein n=1 Tax=Diaporthe citri TaxID=83186 RepID=UPI001C7F8660|nr:uncharacterized protein INS49_004117 [Diaporthe citri]KAG6355036.1 hypothetical protein INS49_004117 [Diaporthe citri]